ERQDIDQPPKRLDGASVAFRGTSEGPFGVGDPALLDRDLPDERLGAHPAPMPFLHSLQGGQGLIVAVAVEEQPARQHPRRPTPPHRAPRAPSPASDAARFPRPPSAGSRAPTGSLPRSGRESDSTGRIPGSTRWPSSTRHR